MERKGVVARTLALTAALVACEPSAETANDTPPALQAALAARTVYPAKREEWRSDITAHTDSTMQPRVFQASRTTVALLQATPDRISLFELHGHGLLLSTRPARVDAGLTAQVPRDIVAPTELSRVTSDGQLDIVDSASSTLIRESIGGFVFRRDLPLLRGGSGRVCTMYPATLLHIRILGERRALEAFTLTANAKDDALVGRHRITAASSSRLRFGSGDARRCLLISEREVLVVSAPEQNAAAVPRGATANGGVMRLSPLRPPRSAAPLTIEQRGRALTTDSTNLLQPFIVDAAVVDGGFVVLNGVSTDTQGRILDYYDERGGYLQSAMLPFTASAMTGAGPRFLALHQDDRFRWWLSSWLTPMAAHGATAPPDPPPISQTQGRQLLEPTPRRAPM